MSISLSSIAHTSFGQMERTLHTILEKGASHAKDHGIDEVILLNWRLAPDMFTMTRQIQIACDISARGLARLAGADIPSFPDTEKSFSDLKERVQAASKFVNRLDRAAIDANPDGDVTFPVRDAHKTMKRSDFMNLYIIPNLHFHATTAYANLRACGVALGKGDFLGG